MQNMNTWWISRFVLLFILVFSSFVHTSDIFSSSSLNSSEHQPLFREAKMLMQPLPKEKGALFQAVVELPLKSSWYTYWKNPGDTGMAPSFSWSLPQGISLVSVEWPIPQQFVHSISDAETDKSISITSFGYEGIVRWIVTFRRENFDISSSPNASITATLSWLACSDTACLPQEIQLSSLLSETIYHDLSVKTFQDSLTAASASIPRPEPGVKGLINPEDGAITLMLPIQRRYDEKLQRPLVDSAYLFLENEGIQSTAEAKLLLKADGIPFAIRLIIPRNNIELLQRQQKIAGVFTYLTSDSSSSKKRVSGAFFDIPVALFSGISESVQSQSSKQIPLSENSSQIDAVGSRSSSAVLDIQQGPDSGEKAKGSVDKESQEERSIVNDMTFFSSSYLSMAFLAFIGGILLNVMPCVLPVVGLKVLHLISLEKKHKALSLHKKSSIRYGLSFTFGVLSAFWILALIVYTIQYFGSMVGWGFQLQEPAFVVGMILILFAMSLSMFGLYEFGAQIGAKAASFEQSIQDGVYQDTINKAQDDSNSWLTRKHMVSFFSGFFVTLIATPCTGPFLGSVLGFLATLHPFQGFVLFSCLGFGVAFPYLLFTAFPVLLKLLPRPGPWMETFKKILGFCLLFTIIWLSWVLQAQIDDMSVPVFLAMLVTLTISLWIWAHWSLITKKWYVRWCSNGISVLFLIASIVLAVFLVSPGFIAQSLYTSQSGLHQGLQWLPFSQDQLNKELQSGRPILVEVTAKWCLTCQTNKLVFFSQHVEEALLKNDVLLMRADWTKKDEAITLFLRQYGRNGVPVYLLFYPGNKKGPLILPELLTKEAVLQALDTLKEPHSAS